MGQIIGELVAEINKDKLNIFVIRDSPKSNDIPIVTIDLNLLEKLIPHK